MNEGNYRFVLVWHVILRKVIPKSVVSLYGCVWKRDSKSELKNGLFFPLFAKRISKSLLILTKLSIDHQWNCYLQMSLNPFSYQMFFPVFRLGYLVPEYEQIRISLKTNLYLSYLILVSLYLMLFCLARAYFCIIISKKRVRT